MEACKDTCIEIYTKWYAFFQSWNCFPAPMEIGSKNPEDARNHI